MTYTNSDLLAAIALVAFAALLTWINLSTRATYVKLPSFVLLVAAIGTIAFLLVRGIFL